MLVGERMSSVRCVSNSIAGANRNADSTNYFLYVLSEF